VPVKLECCFKKLTSSSIFCYVIFLAESLKSEISLVHEIALKRNFTVEFEVSCNAVIYLNFAVIAWVHKQKSNQIK